MKPRPLFAPCKCLALFAVLCLVAAGRVPLKGAEPPPAPAAKSPGEQIAPPKDVAELRAIEARVQGVVAKVLPCVVNVQVGPSQGSAVIVSKDGLVMTAGHVVGKPGQQVVFRFADGKTAKGTTLGIYHCADAGLMKITDKGDWPYAEKGRAEDLKLGAWCVTVGHPLGYRADRPPVVRIGRLLRIEASTIQTDCPIVAGDSGGPVFNLDGKVIGINSRIGTEMEQNLHVPVTVFHDKWDRMVKGEVFHEGLPSRDCDQVKAAFRPAVAEAGRCVVRVKCNGKEAVLGTIVGPDGWVLTKASELTGKVVCRLPDQRELEARTVGVNPAFDLAMLKIDAAGLAVIPWGNQDPAVGGWVAAPGPGDTPLAVGVVSVPRRTIPRATVALNIVLADANGGARIESVVPQGLGDKAGLKVQDIIIQVDGKPIKDRVEAVNSIKQHRLGEKVRLTVKRGDQTKEFEIALAKPDNPGTRKREFQNRSGVGISTRADDFPKVLQHDTALKPVDCGGPLVDLNGKVVGVNIAHGGRTETYCVPSDVLLPMMYDLMSGRMPPPPAPKPAEKPPEAKPQAKPPEAKPEPKAEPKPEAKPQPKPEPKPDPKPPVQPPPQPKPPEAKPEPKPAEKPPETKPEPKPPEAKPEAKPVEKPPEAKPEPKAEPKPEAKPEPKPAEKPPEAKRP